MLGSANVFCVSCFIVLVCSSRCASLVSVGLKRLETSLEEKTTEISQEKTTSFSVQKPQSNKKECKNVCFSRFNFYKKTSLRHLQYLLPILPFDTAFRRRGQGRADGLENGFGQAAGDVVTWRQ